MALRIKKVICPDVKVYWDSEYREFVVKDKRNPAADYFTDDLEDAVGTGEIFAKHVY